MSLKPTYRKILSFRWAHLVIGCLNQQKFTAYLDVSINNKYKYKIIKFTKYFSFALFLSSYTYYFAFSAVLGTLERISFLKQVRIIFIDV